MRHTLSHTHTHTHTHTLSVWPSLFDPSWTPCVCWISWTRGVCWVVWWILRGFHKMAAGGWRQNGGQESRGTLKKFRNDLKMKGKNLCVFLMSFYWKENLAFILARCIRGEKKCVMFCVCVCLCVCVCVCVCLARGPGAAAVPGFKMPSRGLSPPALPGNTKQTHLLLLLRETSSALFYIFIFYFVLCVWWHYSYFYQWLHTVCVCVCVCVCVGAAEYNYICRFWWRTNY